ncbi:MAG: hypothetical protein CFE31_18625 [Rhizobiales bacterium PAR1]|nr:MAG: hypothetical protein CFE31_18625 [Rhizobiales bacterium PAR1]
MSNTPFETPAFLQTPAFTEFFRISGEAFKFDGATPQMPPVQMFDFWLRVNSEALRFVSQRLAAQAEFLAGLRGCKDVDAVVKAETRFMENAADDYTQELDRLASAAQAASESPVAPKKKALKTA